MGHRGWGQGTREQETLIWGVEAHAGSGKEKHAR